MNRYIPIRQLCPENIEEQDCLSGSAVYNQSGFPPDRLGVCRRCLLEAVRPQQSRLFCLESFSSIPKLIAGILRASIDTEALIYQPRTTKDSEASVSETFLPNFNVETRVSSENSIGDTGSTKGSLIDGSDAMCRCELYTLWSCPCS